MDAVAGEPRVTARQREHARRRGGIARRPGRAVIGRYRELAARDIPPLVRAADRASDAAVRDLLPLHAAVGRAQHVVRTRRDEERPVAGEAADVLGPLDVDPRPARGVERLYADALRTRDDLRTVRPHGVD